MVARKWFLLVGGNGKGLTSTTSVGVDAEDVDTLRDAVKEKFRDSHLAGIAASDLTVFVNRAEYDAKRSVVLPHSWSPVTAYGNNGENALIVQVPKRAESDSRYFIQPNVQEQVEKAVFVIVEEDGERNGVGMGVFFSSTLAVTCDHNLTEQHTVGSMVSLALKEGIEAVEVVARSSLLDFAILKSSKPRSFFIPPWNGRPDELRGRYDLVLASYRFGIDEYQDVFKNQLGFAPVAGISISAYRRHIMYSCPTYAGDSGAALLLKDGFLVGIHLETINALREEMDRKKTIKDRLNDVEESLDNIARSGLAQGCSFGLLAHEFKDVVSE
ncbi:CRN domain-containing protein-containing protein [Phytophthora infestans T30-4]|uniref:CRN domain-containing protein-containing protein n=1 Tax=Phytophthora infestans (strain T30-4) TaxID=403677 RepID=D0N229_PHYIT|nr:CRN domain-containing protein-containing protein [Phytophthora infestans T30-4]EEY68358.1 CRN domain-containing protein-containing protein [Phytophthora infestans T30-4]|eukprot:XP_002905517.1 CRN domain-containing protein-containing protein [Phytophthora infestans T30-4]